MPLVSSRIMTKSTFFSTRAFSGADSDRAGLALIGRRFAYRSYLLRSDNSPPALHASAGTSLVSGPPVAPQRMASASSIASAVSSGNTLPVARYGMRPYCASRNTIGTPRLPANQSRMRRDCAVTSGPMPSPPTTAIFIMFDDALMHDSLQNESRAARFGPSPERHEFRRRVAASTRSRRGL